MDNILITLLGGLTIIAAIFILLYNVSNMSGKMVAIVMAFIVTAVYVPISIFLWPGADIFAIHIAMYLVSVYILGIITSQRDLRRQSGKQGFGFHWAPAAIVTFFVLLLIMDSFFVMFATKGMNSNIAKWLLPAPTSGGKISSHFPGTVSHDYHQKQNQYNDYVQRFETQKQLDWSVSKGWLGEAVANKPSIFRVEIKTKKNTVIKGAKVSGVFLRPADSKLDVEFNMQEIEPGVYQQSMVLTQPGNWDLILKIHKDSNVYEVRAKTVIK
ncbi:MAG: FixH family protein [Woeseiaceae bacterium]